MRYLFDLETNGLLDEVNRIHCVGIIDLDTGHEWGFGPSEIDKALDMLANAELICGHNIIKYDLPVIRKLYPNWTTKATIRDTIVMCRLAYPEVSKRDFAMKVFNNGHARLVGSHSLKAWGIRLKMHKGDLDTDWQSYSSEMLEYCLQDVRVTKAIWDRFIDDCSPESMELEHQVATIVHRLEERGWCFDLDKAIKLLASLKKEVNDIKRELIDIFGSWFVSDGQITPKRPNKRYGYEVGSTLTKVRLVEFNPSSRPHIIKVLQKKYGWQPTQFTNQNQPIVDERVLNSLDYPEAKLISRYLLLEKRLGQLCDGKNAWISLERDGRLHCSINTNGTVTGRCTHRSPNLGQVPSVGSPYGKECRELFKPTSGYKLVGIDASALELRCLAHFMANYDGGSYVDTVVNGKKEDGSEIHTVNMQALEIDSRDLAKRWLYGFIYGAGNSKLGEIVGGGNKECKRLREFFLKYVPALATLQERVQIVADERKHLLGLDKRKLHVRSLHSSLNLLLQSAGSLIVKQALCIFDDPLQKEHGLIPGDDYEFLAFVHDEFQIECKPELVDLVGQVGLESFRKSGEEFKLNCPIDAEWKEGANWSQTH